MSQTTTKSSSPNRISVPSCLLWGRDSLPIQVLIDSGADDSFIDSDLAKQLDLPLEPLPVPKDVTALDGRLMTQVQFRTAPLTLIISGNHREDLQLFVIPSPHYPVVLGLPWLKLHNPQINWETAAITNWSIHCHSHCLRSANPSSKRPLVTPTPPDLSSVPPDYHDLAPVFSKELALSLPPHRPYDCAIDLLPGAPILLDACIIFHAPRETLWRRTSRIHWLPVSFALPHPLLGQASFLSRRKIPRSDRALTSGALTTSR